MRSTPVLTVRKVGAKGLGVFALTEVPKGTGVIRYYGKSRWIWDIPRWEWDHLFQVEYDRYVSPRAGSYGWSINHSCGPNCGVRGERELVAIRAISKGEELTFDYSTNVGWDGFQMVCACGAPDCRGVITSYGKLDDRWKVRYEGLVSPFLLKPPRNPRPTLF